jgi:hypothetical protein
LSGVVQLERGPSESLITRELAARYRLRSATAAGNYGLIRSKALQTHNEVRVRMDVERPPPCVMLSDVVQRRRAARQPNTWAAGITIGVVIRALEGQQSL